MTDNRSQEAETTREEAIEKLIELSAQNSNDFECYLKYFPAAILGDREYSYLTWLKDDRFSPHVKLAIYIELFNCCQYHIAETRLDQAQADQDMFDYLCDYLNEKSYRPYRNMLNNFFELMGRLMCFDYPTKTCKMIVDIVQNPEKYNKQQVCCGLDVLHNSHYRFEITWQNSGQIFYKDIAEKWKIIILETDDEDICIEGIYYVLEKGQLEPSKYIALVKKLWDKHPHDRVSVEIYKEYLRPSIMLLAFDRLKILREYDANLGAKALRRFSNAVSSSEFLHSINFDLNNELIQFCISNADALTYFVEGMDRYYYYDGYFKIIDIVLSIYLSVESLSKLKIICLNVMIKNFHNHNYLKRKETFNAYLNMLDTYVEKITNKYRSNLKNSIIKLRCTQALALLFADFKIHNDVKKKIMDSILLILTEEAKFSPGNAAIKHIMLYTYLSMLKTPIKYQEIEKLLEKVKDTPELYESYLLILYHVLLNFKCSEDELNSLLSVVVQHKNDNNTRIHALTQVLYDRLANFCKRKHFKNVELLQSEVDSASNESELGPDRVFLKNLNPFAGISREIVLCLIPKLNEIDTDEWKNNMMDNYFFIGPKSKLNPIVDNFKTAIDEFLSNKETHL